MIEQHKEFQPPIELPPPRLDKTEMVAEEGGSEVVNEKGKVQNIERGVSSINPPANLSMASTPFQASSLGQGAATVPVGFTDASSTAALIADDVDLIEKEWVRKAKEIVQDTKNDPYEQNQKINIIKADYLKKRYNKELKLAED